MQQRAFSLIELSIVLVILGLLTGGILAGKSLIRASELRSVAVEYNRYLTATNAFRDRYFGLPGDIKNATTIWGTATTCPGTSLAQGSTDAKTCNGDGDGRLSNVSPAVTSPGVEFFRYWQQLANAGLIEGQYSGVPQNDGVGEPGVVAGNNAPASKLNGAVWGIYDWGNTSTPISNTQYFDGVYYNPFFLGGAVAYDINNAPILRPEEAWNLDTKLDDGKPGIGRVRVPESQTTCHDSSNTATVAAAAVNYNLANSSVVCSLILNSQ